MIEKRFCDNCHDLIPPNTEYYDATLYVNPVKGDGDTVVSVDLCGKCAQEGYTVKAPQ